MPSTYIPAILPYAEGGGGAPWEAAWEACSRSQMAAMQLGLKTLSRPALAREYLASLGGGSVRRESAHVAVAADAAAAVGVRRASWV